MTATASETMPDQLWRPGGRALVINGRFLGDPMSGVGRVGREILRALVETLRARGLPPVLLALPEGALIPTPEGDSTTPPPELRLAPLPGGKLGEQLLALRFPDATILSFANVTPLLARRSIVWIHDTHVFDAPDSYSPAFRLAYRAQLAAIIARKFEVVTVSAFSRAQLLSRGVPAERLTMIENGGDHILRTPSDARALDAAGLSGKRFVLVMGSPARHKNMPFALKALSAGLPGDIAIAAVGLHQTGPYLATEQIPADPRLIILPRVNDGELRALYGAAGAVVVPSVLEGFGLPAAEALFEHAPLVLARATALPEVGGEAALYFDPTDPSDLVRATSAALGDEAAPLRAKAALQAEKFHWRRAADSLVVLLERT